MEQQGSQLPPKWEGTVRAKLGGATADEAWSLLGDFCSLDRWVPTIHTCHKLDGVDGEPGCVRYCAGPVNRADSSQPVGWAKERLIAFHPLARCYTYEIVETNKGFGRYSATIGIVPAGEEEGDGCLLEWSFEADPVKGWSRDGFVEFLGKLTDDVARRVEAEVKRAGK